MRDKRPPNPRRLVVRTKTTGRWRKEWLECGHWIVRRSSLPVAEYRLCWGCGEGRTFQ